MCYFILTLQSSATVRRVDQVSGLMRVALARAVVGILLFIPHVPLSPVVGVGLASPADKLLSLVITYLHVCRVFFNYFVDLNLDFVEISPDMTSCDMRTWHTRLYVLTDFR
jgi:hypothetical protein